MARFERPFDQKTTQKSEGRIILLNKKPHFRRNEKKKVFADLFCSACRMAALSCIIEEAVCSPARTYSSAA